MLSKSIKFYKYLTLLFIFSYCKTKDDSSSFKEIQCQPAIIGNENSLFTPCKTFVYSAKYWSENLELISKSHVQMIPLAQQDPEAINGERLSNIQYIYTEDEVEFINTFNINSEFLDRSWLRSISGAYVENENDIWMQPFRENQFVFTQVAPFPSVSLPLALNKQWTSNLIIYEGWGDWNNQQLISNYSVVDNGKVKLEFMSLDSVWHVSSYVETAFGVSKHDFWFHETYGFVKMLYKNYQGQLLLFELEQVL